MRTFIISISILAVLLAVAFIFLPWKMLVGQQLQSNLEGRGIPIQKLHVSGLSLQGVELDDIVFGKSEPVTLKNVTIGYSWTGIKSGVLDSLKAAGVSVVVRQQDQKWTVLGFEDFIKTDANRPPVTVSSLTKTFQNLPLTHVEIQDSLMNIQTDAWSLSFPMNATLVKSPDAGVLLQISSADFGFNKVHVKSKEATADIDLDQNSQVWSGTWKADDIAVEGLSQPVPTLKANGTIKAENVLAVTEGELYSDDKAYHLQFAHHQSFDAAVPSILTIVQGAMPWKQGLLSVKGVKVPLGAKQSITFNLEVSQVSIDELLGALTGQKVTATGTVSGIVPITINQDGSLTFKQGTLQAEGPGMINLPPDAIPGDNEQIMLVRQILENFGYTALSIRMNSDDEKNLGILMSIEGNNPDVYNGRAVKLNVNLTGDVLDFIQQNIMLLKNPQSLWEQGASE